MPPKKSNKPSSNQVKKAKDKIVEDKTFGLKNKNKSKKVQQYVNQVKQQADAKMAKYEKGKEEARLKRLAAKEEQKQQEMMNQLIKVAIEPPVLAPGVDPKSVFCPYFKAGQCARGDRCKYSHDESSSRKGAKLDIYQDRRDAKETSEGWDDDKLRSVVQEKHSGQKCLSTIICKYFLEAVRQKKYGWFWECPNGETCHYRHALPPGFVLEEKKVSNPDDEEEVTPLEEILEMELAKLSGQGTPVTEDRFKEWNTTRKKRKDEKMAAEKVARDKELAAGRAANLTGRELLQFRPELFLDEDPSTAGESDFDYAALRAQLLAEEDAEAEASVKNYQDQTKDFDMDIDESLFLGGGDVPEDDGSSSNNNNNNNNNDDGDGDDDDGGNSNNNNNNAGTD